jgi:hypothetical protein
MKMRWIPAAAAAALLLALVPASRAQMSESAARSVVSTRNYVSLQPVPRGRTFEVAVVARIKPGYHVNAHKVLDEFLISTRIEGKVPAGFRLLSTDYPAGELRQLPFSKKKLLVYTGQVILRMKLEADSAAPLGAQQIPLSLRYQACNNSMCLPPVNVPVAIHLTVAKAGTPAKATHTEIFRHSK